MIALPDDYIAQKSLHVSQRFPWDKTKGVYLLNGHHALHCTVRIIAKTTFLLRSIGIQYLPVSNSTD